MILKAGASASSLGIDPSLMKKIALTWSMR